MINKEDVKFGSQVRFIDTNYQTYLCCIVAIDSGDTDMPFLVSFGTDTDDAPNGVRWRMSAKFIDSMNEDKNVETNLTYKNCDELAIWAIPEELELLV